MGDVHGHLDALRGALRRAGLMSSSGNWAGDRARLWFLGDLVDRGPDGLAVIDLIRRLGRQASSVGGHVTSLLGNHEILLIGARHFGNAIATNAPRGFLDHWLLNGGQPSDFTGMTDAHVSWLLALPAVACVDDHLLLHADTTAYLDYGDTIDDINHQIRAILTGREIDQWWTCFQRLTRRVEFAASGGTAAAQDVRRRLGARWIVHGHTPIADLLDARPSDITAIHVYANGTVIAADSGLYDGGPCLVTQLPIHA